MLVAVCVSVSLVYANLKVSYIHTLCTLGALEPVKKCYG